MPETDADEALLGRPWMPRADQSSACAWRGRPVRSCVSTRMGEERDAATDAPPAPDGGEEVAAAGPQSTAATDGDDEPEDTLFGYLGRKADGLLEKLGNLGEDLSSSTSSAVETTERGARRGLVEGGKLLERAESAVIASVAAAEAVVVAAFKASFGVVKEAADASVATMQALAGSQAEQMWERARRVANTGVAHTQMGEQMLVDVLKQPIYWSMEHTTLTVPCLLAGALFVSPVTRGFLLSRVLGRFRSATQLVNSVRRDLEVMAEEADQHGKEVQKLLLRIKPAADDFKRSQRRLQGAVAELRRVDTRLAYDIEKNAGLLVRVRSLPRGPGINAEPLLQAAEKNRSSLAVARHQVKAALASTP